MRADYIARLQEAMSSVLPMLSSQEDVSLEYYPGWKAESEALAVVYRSDLAVDQKRGFTQRGFQRADVRIKVSGKPAVEVCSRGELKALVWSMLLAQGQIQNEHEDTQQCLYLVDDLASEFDETHRRRVCKFLEATGQQVLLTGVDRSALEQASGGAVGRMFHVKQGNVEVQET